ncbi:hypothetical protein [Streptomyces violaceusniger]|uniref:Uncharacterized protein n=1 Tax=Streptomyces violaceusniger (strain Tu 4113) TaxID=653045 RepID=G2PHX2_STRV4|nr:hypothetical protein [Streptomyces violaceusniger]AEM88923.1 hypothetical protein Strvi_0148 [Streptomyces violaceusniger Tu 4113]
MGRKILVYCDAHSSDGKEVEAQIVDIAVRIADPNEPSSVRVVTGSLEICSDHQTPITDIASMLEEHGRKLNEEAQQHLVNAVRLSLAKTAESDQFLCMDCSPPKLLKKGSLYSHSDKIHGKKRLSDTNYKPYFPNEHADMAAVQ